MPPHLRLPDPDYCRPYRRNRRGMDARPIAEQGKSVRPATPDRPATENTYKLAFDLEADLVGIATGEDYEAVGLDLCKHLPDANSLIVFGCRFPETAQLPGSSTDDARPDGVTGSALSDWLGFIQLDVCRYLESLGIEVAANMVGEILTVQEQAGFQLNIARWNDEFLRLWNTPARTIAFR